MPFSYQAPNPYEQQNFCCALPLPSIPNPLNLIPVEQVILPALDIYKTLSPLDEAALQSAASAIGLKSEQGTVQTHDGASLDTVSFSPIGGPARYIIKFNGNAQAYQYNLREMASDSLKLNAEVVGFNYRGVGKTKQSGPNQYQDLVTDGIAQVNRLLEKGVQPQQILLDGYSIGGSVATMVAKHFHDLGQKVYLWNDRSFSSLGAAASGLMSHPAIEGLGSNMLFGPVLSARGWDVDVAEAYQNISIHYKGHTYVHPSANNKKGDGIISNKASLHAALSSDPLQSGAALTLHHPIDGHAHTAPRRSLFFFKPAPLLMEPSPSVQDAHTQKRAPQEQAEPTTAQDLFEQFAIRVK